MLRSRRLLAVALLAVLALPACTDEQDPISPISPNAALLPRPGSSGIVVMTRNIYLGAEITGILAVPLEGVPLAAAQAWAEVQATDFHARAELLADEIAATNPHLVGLNEVALYRVQMTSDILAVVNGVPTFIGAPVPNATTEAYDFVEILLAALEARGLDYRVASHVTDHDLEVPAFAGMDGPLPLFMDVRYTDHDVILARADVVTSDPWGQTYAASLPIPLGPVTLPLLRGWTSVEATVAGQEFLFVSTHLEVQEYPFIQIPQVTELLGWLEGYDGTVVLTGDLNSAANPSALPASRTATYPMLLAAGFEDTWLRKNDADEGLTCCQLATLLNEESRLNQRLDLILVRPAEGRMVGPFHATTVGDDASVRTPTGLWASDHAGVAAILRVAGSVAMR